ncbi:MAG: hypothetical protein ACLGH0_13245, partial [Thermoanaerobaculia bacterium]
EVAASVSATDTVASLQGAPVDRDAFRFARPIPDAPAGLTLLALDADVLARSSDFRDIRIADKSNKQIPYLVEKRDEPLVVPVRLVRQESPRGKSIYRIALPYATLPWGTRLVLTTSARVFERDVTLRATTGTRNATLAQETWRAADPELLPPALTFEPPRSGHRELELVVDEGENAPLPIASAELLLPSAVLRFHHPGTPLVLLYGNREAEAPRYDLSLLAPRLFGEPARELTLAAAAPRVDEESKKERSFFWIIIALVAVVLLGMLAKLLRPQTPVSG